MHVYDAINYNILGVGRCTRNPASVNNFILKSWICDYHRVVTNSKKLLDFFSVFFYLMFLALYLGIESYFTLSACDRLTI